MKRVFISHPFTGDPIENLKKVDKICKDINMDKGTLAVSPLHMFSYMNDDSKRNPIMIMCYDLINICDEVWIYGDSIGCNQERFYAEHINKKVVMK